MNALLLAAAMFAFGAQDFQITTSQPATKLYVKTIPSGAEVNVDGKTVGKSDGLFDVTAGTHKLALRMEDYAPEERSIEIGKGEITRVEVKLKTQSKRQVDLSYVGDASNDRRSLADSGFAVLFQRPADMKSIVGVKLFAARYGNAEPPKEDFHVYLLDQNKKVLEQIAVPYGKIERGDLRWYTLSFPAVDVPEKFFVALWFNAERTKGIYLGMESKSRESHSYLGLPDKGYQKVKPACEWMIRATVSSESGKKPSRSKVTTYEEENATDTESAEALPVRTWNDATGAFSVDAQFAGVEHGKVMLKKTGGKLVAVPLEQLSQEDRDFVAQQTGAKPATAKPVETRELSHDDGTLAGKSSIAGGGHAVKFKVDGDSWYVTSLSLHGSRYGEARPPKENFKVWICDAEFKPIASFEFPYSAYVRGTPAWKSFRIRPTRVPQDFIVCFGFNPHSTKGVLVSYDAKPGETSLIGVPGESPLRPFTKGNWLIRCKVEKRSESGAKTN